MIENLASLSSSIAPMVGDFSEKLATETFSKPGESNVGKTIAEIAKRQINNMAMQYLDSISTPKLYKESSGMPEMSASQLNAPIEKNNNTFRKLAANVTGEFVGEAVGELANEAAATVVSATVPGGVFVAPLVGEAVGNATKHLAKGAVKDFADPKEQVSPTSYNSFENAPKNSMLENIAKNIAGTCLEEVVGDVDILPEDILNNPIETKELEQSLLSDNSLEKTVENISPLSTSELNESIFTKEHGYCPIEGNNGHWEGERGESKWCPEPEAIPQKNNPEGKTWGEVMSEFGIDGISFSEGEPNFSEVSKGEVTLDAPESDRGMVFNEADEKLAAEKGCSPDEVREWRKEHRYTWHEKQDGLTTQIVPSIVHGNISHIGGHSVTSRALK